MRSGSAEHLSNMMRKMSRLWRRQLFVDPGRFVIGQHCEVMKKERRWKEFCKMFREALTSDGTTQRQKLHKQRRIDFYAQCGITVLRSKCVHCQIKTSVETQRLQGFPVQTCSNHNAKALDVVVHTTLTFTISSETSEIYEGNGLYHVCIKAMKRDVNSA